MNSHREILNSRFSNLFRGMLTNLNSNDLNVFLFQTFHRMTQWYNGLKRGYSNAEALGSNPGRETRGGYYLCK